MTTSYAPHYAALQPARRAVAAAGRWEKLAAALCLAQFSEPLFAAIAQSRGLTEPPEYARIFFLPVYAFLIWALWRERDKAAAAVRATPFLFALLALAFASTFWSIDAGGTFRRCVWLAASMSFAGYLAWRYDWRALMGVLAGAYLVLIVGSFVTALIAPSVGVMTTEHPGAWSGLWTHKNMLGGYMALGVAIGIAAAVADLTRRRLWFCVALGAFALVLLSTSKTALLATLLGLAVMAACAIARRGPLQALLMGAGGALAATAVGVIFLFAPSILADAIGRDLTLTGRTDIWHAAGAAAAAHPWFGYGYYVFWLPADGPAYWVRQAVGWPVQSAHSGWLETALGVGFAGVSTFALQLIATFMRGARAIFDGVAGLWAPAFLAMFALYTPSETHVLTANDLFWIIYVAVAAKLSLDARAAKRSAAP